MLVIARYIAFQLSVYSSAIRHMMYLESLCKRISVCSLAYSCHFLHACDHIAVIFGDQKCHRFEFCALQVIGIGIDGV